MLLTGKKKTQITIQTPKGIPFHAEILDISRQERTVRCAVRKDGGDDPDVTTGALIYVTVTLKDEEAEMEEIWQEGSGGKSCGRGQKELEGAAGGFLWSL